MASAAYYAYAINNAGKTNQAYRGKLELNESVDQTANTSTIEWKFYVWCTYNNTSSAYYYRNGNGVTVTMNGQTLVSTSNIGTVDMRGHGSNNPLLLTSGTITVPHNDDGSKSFAFLAMLDQEQTNSSFNYLKIEGTHECTNIVRGNQVSITWDGDKPYIGETVLSFAVSRAMEGSTTSLILSFGSKTYTLATKSTGTSFSYTLPASWASEIPNTTNGTVTLTVKTYGGDGNLVSSIPQTFTAYLPSSIVPTITGFSCAPINENTYISGLGSVYVSWYSKVHAVVNAVAGTGSSLTSCAIRFSGLAQNIDGSGFNYTSGVVVLGQSEKQEITVTATVADARGRTATTTQTILVYAYVSPLVNSLAYQRGEWDGTAWKVDANGNDLKITAQAVTRGDVPGNELTLTFYVDNESKSVVGNVTGGESTIVYLKGISGSTPHTLSCVAVDKIGESGNRENVIPTAQLWMDFHSDGKSIAFGKVAEKAGYEFNDDVTVNGSVHANNLPDGMTDYVVEDGVTETYWTWRKWKSGLAECWYRGYKSGISCQYQWGAIYSHGVATITSVNYPIDFINNPMCEVTPIHAGSGSVFLTSYAPGDKTKTPEWEAVRGTAATGQALDYMIYAVGRWK